MNKRICMSLAVCMALCLCGCKSANEEKKEMYLAGYIVDRKDDNIVIGSAAGNYNFDISNAEIITEDSIDVDDTCEVYYKDELKTEEVNIATKIIEYYASSIIGEVTEINSEKNTFKITADNTTYEFNIPSSLGNKIEDIEQSQTYEVKFDKKLSSTNINEAVEINVLEVDDAPSEELELVDSSNVQIVD